MTGDEAGARGSSWQRFPCGVQEQKRIEPLAALREFTVGRRVVFHHDCTVYSYGAEVHIPAGTTAVVTESPRVKRGTATDVMHVRFDVLRYRVTNHSRVEARLVVAPERCRVLAEGS